MVGIVDIWVDPKYVKIGTYYFAFYKIISSNRAHKLAFLGLSNPSSRKIITMTIRKYWKLYGYNKLESPFNALVLVL